MSNADITVLVLQYDPTDRLNSGKAGSRSQVFSFSHYKTEVCNGIDCKASVLRRNLFIYLIIVPEIQPRRLSL